MDHLDVLHELVYQDQKTVTYRMLSRRLGLHVNLAKQMLYAFLEADPPSGVITRAEGTYCLTGYTKPEKESAGSNAKEDGHTAAGDVAGDFLVLLVAADKLEHAKSRFATLTGIHVYSVGIARPKDPDVVIAANLDMPVSETSSTTNFGIIKNPKIHVSERKNRNESSASATEESEKALAKSASATEESEKALAKSAMHPAVARSKSSVSAASSISASLAKRSPSMGSLRGKKEGGAKAKASSCNGSRTRETFFGKPRVKAKQDSAKPRSPDKDITAESENEPSDSDEEERDRRIALESARAALEMEKLPIGDVHAGEDDDTARQAERRAEVIAGLEQAEREEADSAAAEAVEEAAEQEANRSAEQETNNNDMGAKQRKRGRRKVSKTVISINDRGYRQTRDVMEWESFSEDEPEPLQKRIAVEDEVDETKVHASSPCNSPTKTKGPSTSTGAQKVADAGKSRKKKRSAGHQRSLLQFWKK